MFKRLLLGGLIACTILGLSAILLTGEQAASASPNANVGGISYASMPDEAALYLNDMVFARDTVVLPNEAVRVLLPPGTVPNTLILTENGERVREYRITPQTEDVYYSQASFRYDTNIRSGGGLAYSVIWDSTAADEADTRSITLNYLMSGAYWTPTYDMNILSDTSVEMAFFAEIHNSSLVLDNATVSLVAGRVDLSQVMSDVSNMTFNQMAVGYAESQVDTTASLAVGAVDLQHIYPLGEISAEPGDIVYINLVNQTLNARRLLVWNASGENEVNVIYKVLNETETPFAEGIVRNYQDNLFVGSDFVEVTPPGSEGSVTVGSLPDVRVSRTASSEYFGGSNDYYLHSVELQLNNFSDIDIDVIILDRWEEKAWQFEYSLTPERQQDNLLRWEVSIAAGESLTITYTYRTEY